MDTALFTGTMVSLIAIGTSILIKIIEGDCKETYTPIPDECDCDGLESRLATLESNLNNINNNLVQITEKNNLQEQKLTSLEEAKVQLETKVVETQEDIIETKEDIQEINLEQDQQDLDISSIFNDITFINDINEQQQLDIDALFVLVGSDDRSNPVKTPPSEILDLTIWKITLPTPMRGDGSFPADEVKQPTLNGFVDENYFYGDNNKVIFKCPMGGARTSANTSYPRCELREMKNNGLDRADWTWESGTHIMNMSCSFDIIPQVKKESVIAQIHDSQNDVIMIKIYSDMSIKAHGTYVGENFTLLENYVLGTPFNLEIKVENKTLTANIDNGIQYSKVIDAVNGGCYFKAGLYPQSNSWTKGENPNHITQNSIYSLDISHY